MDFKRLLLALSLSFMFIFVWQTFFMPAPPVNQPQDQTIDEGSINNNQVIATQKNDNKQQTYSIELGGALNIETPLMFIDLNNGGTSIQNLKIIEAHHKKNNPLKHAGAWNKKTGKYNKSAPVQLLNSQTCNPCLVENGQIIFFDAEKIIYNYNEKEITHVIQNTSASGIQKTTIINDTSYVIDHMFSGLNSTKTYNLLWNEGLEPTESNIQDDLTMLSLFAEKDKSYHSETISDANELFNYTNVGWAGLKTKYFIKAITNQKYQSNNNNYVNFKSEEAHVNEDANFIYTDIDFDYGIGNDIIHTYSYIGPIDTKHLQGARTNHLVQLFGFGWFIIGYLGQLILWVLTSLYNIIPNYGVICILFAFIIRLFTGPLTKQSFLSNQKMQKIQPKMKKIQEKYKDDQGKLSQATMELYKKEGVNPLGGCLPILVQMPLLIALFQVFRKTIEFRGAEFLPFWITDLSQPDIILQFDFLKQIPGISYFFGHGIALLPIIMGVVMFLSMKMTATAGQDPSAKFAMYFMNAFFILLFNTFPSGLNLYYTVYNVLNFVQQKQLKQIKT